MLAPPPRWPLTSASAPTPLPIINFTGAAASGDITLATAARARATPSAAARLYGAGQLDRWHWQRIILGWSLLLGAPLALLGIAAGISVATWRQRATPTSPRQPKPGAGNLRTAGR